jgi:hypothetical protein
MSTLVEDLSESLDVINVGPSEPARPVPANLQSSYQYFLTLNDGGYTKDKFFHFFGRRGPAEHNAFDWNEPHLWKTYYGVGREVFCFAEDIFGTQFCFDIRGNRKVVKMLIPDGGKMTLCANTFEEFLETEVLSAESNAKVRDVARRFLSQANVIFQPFTHIGCHIPPSLGGDDTDLGNLCLVRSLANLKILGQITQQVKELPAGTAIRDVKIDYDKEQITLISDNYS